MDRETLSHYGWIVILVLILMCLLFFATPFGSFVANGVKVTLDGYYAVNDKVLDDEYMDSIVEKWENEFLDDETPQEEGKSDTVFTENPDGTVDAVTPLDDVPKIPADELPTTIDFTFGKIESVATYTPGEYITVEYQEDEVQIKRPVGNVGLYTTHWSNGQAGTLDFSNMGKTSTYIAYNLNTGLYDELNGVKSERILTYRIMEDSDDTLGNAIYLAAYYNHTKNAGLHVAKWNGTQYEKVDCDAEINAITTFTEVVTVTKTKQVLVSEASYDATFVFIPLGTMKAETGMTWNEWLASDYNTENIKNTTIRDAGANVILPSSIIEENGEYCLYSVPINVLYKPGLYATDSNYGTMLKSWETLLNDGTFSLSNGALTCNDDTITGDLIIATDGSVTSIGDGAFAYCDSLTSLTIPDSVKYIGYNACYSAAGLQYVDLGNGVERIEEWAFRGCESLLGLTFPDSLTYFNENAGAFLYNQAMSYINLGSGLTKVPQLYGKYEQLVIPEGYTDTGFHVMASFETVYIPTSVTHIGEGNNGIVKQFGGATIYYAGTEEQWNAIDGISKIATNATIIFNSPYTGD